MRVIIYFCEIIIGPFHLIRHVVLCIHLRGNKIANAALDLLVWAEWKSKHFIVLT